MYVNSMLPRICLLHNRSQMTSKHGENKKVAHVRHSPESDTDILTRSLLRCMTEQTHSNMTSIYFTKKQNIFTGHIIYVSVLR